MAARGASAAGGQGLASWHAHGVLVDGEEMKGSRTLLRKVLPEREEEAAVPQVIERLISRGPPAGSGIPFEA
jgi:hypothetical protein